MGGPKKGAPNNPCGYMSTLYVSIGCQLARWLFGAKDYAPEIAEVKSHWKMPLRIHWTIPVKIHWTSDNPSENTADE